MSVPIAPKSAASPSQPADETPAVGHTHRGVNSADPPARGGAGDRPTQHGGRLREEFLHELNTDLGVALSRSSINDQYTALAHTVRNYLTARWLETMRRNRELQPKTVAYLSAEYLLGRQLGNNLLAANLNDIAAKALNGCGLSLTPCAPKRSSPASATVASVGWQPVSSTHWPP